MKYYGKELSELTPKEETLFNKDMILKTSMSMNFKGEKLIGMGMELGTEEDVDARYIDRYITAGKLLGMKKPKSQEEFNMIVETVDSSVYSFMSFLNESKTAEAVSQLEVSVVPN